jgi:hypothetical protein
MAVEILGAALGQVLVLGGFFFWLSKRNTDKIDQIQIDLAIVKEHVRHVREDHDKLILIESRMTQAHKDINNAFEKIRAIN